MNTENTENNMNNENNMNTRYILVTGANKGLGFGIVKRILTYYPDTHILLGSRNILRGETAITQLININPHWIHRITLIQIDVSCDRSVKVAAQKWMNFIHNNKNKNNNKNNKNKNNKNNKNNNNTDIKLYGIINNAGTDSQNIKECMSINVSGPIRVCKAFVKIGRDLILNKNKKKQSDFYCSFC